MLPEKHTDAKVALSIHQKGEFDFELFNDKLIHTTERFENNSFDLRILSIWMITLGLMAAQKEKNCHEKLSTFINKCIDAFIESDDVTKILSMYFLESIHIVLDETHINVVPNSDIFFERCYLINSFEKSYHLTIMFEYAKI